MSKPFKRPNGGMKCPQLLAFLIAATCLVGPSGCTHSPIVPPDPPNPTSGDTEEETPPCDPNVIYFEQDVLPLLQSSCAYTGCHDATTAEDGVVLESYDDLMENSGDDLVVAGQPEHSELYEVLVEEDLDKLMPPPIEGGPLSPEQIQVIWKSS